MATSKLYSDAVAVMGDMNYLLLKVQRLVTTKTEFVVLQKAA